MSPTSIGSSRCYASVFSSVSNLSLFIIGDYYIHSHDKMMKEKIETG